MSQAGILALVHNSQEIAAAIIAYRDNPLITQTRSEAAQQFIFAQGGAADQHVAYIKQLARITIAVLTAYQGFEHHLIANVQLNTVDTTGYVNIRSGYRIVALGCL